jgi:predicted MFS family arabinose efflux permease
VSFAALAARAAPLRSAEFRRFLGGVTLTNTSSWIYYTAVTWTMLQSNGAAAAVAFMPLMLVIPVPVSLLLAGQLTDRRGPRHVLLLSQIAMAAVIALAGVLALANMLSFIPTLAIGFLVGVITGFQTVPSQALIVRLVDQRDAASAYSTSLLTIGIARIVGGPVGGALVAVGGPGPAFLVAAAGAGGALLLFVALPQTEGLAKSAITRSTVLDIGRALTWATKARAALLMIVADALLSAFIFPYMAMLSLVARDVLHGTSADMGLLIAAGGVGVLIGAFTVQDLGRWLGQGRLLVVALVASAIGVAGLGSSSVLLLSAGLAGLVAAATNAFGVTEGLLLQTMTPPPIRGRVLAIDGVVANVANPLGILAVGLLAEQFGAGPVMLGMAVVAVGGVFAILAVRRPVVLLDVDEDGQLVDARRAVRAEEPVPDDGLDEPTPVDGGDEPPTEEAPVSEPGVVGVPVMAGAMAVAAAEDDLAEEGVRTT